MRKPTKTDRTAVGLLGSILVLGNAIVLPQLVTTPCTADTESSAEANAVRAVLRCIPRTGKGRVLCDLDLDVTTGRLTWADLIIIKAPSFALPLRDRVGMREATERSATHLRLPFALIAQDAGEGQITIKSRAVWCRPTTGTQESCNAVTKTASGSVTVTGAGG